MSAGPASLLTITPGHELQFTGPFNRIITSTINLANPTSERITFKVKTTVPKRYCVRPSCGIVEPEDNLDVVVMLQPFEFDASEKNKHKFMVQSMLLDDQPHESLELLWKNVDTSKVSDTKLRCVLKLPDEIIQVDPSVELVFLGPLSEPSSQIVKVRNCSDNDVCFKVKTNASLRYGVSPNEGIIKAKQTQPIQITLTSLSDFDMERTKDKIVIMSTNVPKDMTVSRDQIWQTVDKSDVFECVLKCIVMLSEKGTLGLETIVPKDSRQDQQSREPDQASAAMESFNRKALVDEIMMLKNEIAELKESRSRLARLGMDDISGIGSFSQARVTRTNNIPPILYMIVTFLFALLLGKYAL